MIQMALAIAFAAKVHLWEPFVALGLGAVVMAEIEFGKPSRHGDSLVLKTPLIARVLLTCTTGAAWFFAVNVLLRDTALLIAIIWLGAAGAVTLFTIDSFLRRIVAGHHRCSVISLPRLVLRRSCSIPWHDMTQVVVEEWHFTIRTANTRVRLERIYVGLSSFVEYIKIHHPSIEVEVE